MKWSPWDAARQKPTTRVFPANPETSRNSMSETVSPAVKLTPLVEEEPAPVVPPKPVETQAPLQATQAPHQIPEVSPPPPVEPPKPVVPAAPMPLRLALLHIGGAITSLMAKKGTTPEAVSQATGVHVNKIYAIMTGRESDVGVATLSLLVQYLGATFTPTLDIV